MITKENFDKVLAALGFEQDGAKWFRQYSADHENRLVVDFGRETLAYPKALAIHRETTTNFSAPENFVVFECVARLLAKGYKPANIELESPIHGGHHDVVAWNDILVKNNEGQTFLLIECKKEDEFEKYWKKTLIDGSQLFNYFNTYREAEALCLYTSDWTEADGLSYRSHIISMRDNDEYLQTNKELASFRSIGEKKGGGTKDDYFRVWADTYQKEFETAGIFEENIEAYTVGKLKYTAADLEEPKDNSKYNEFATIMRRHNVGSHENAFDKLVNLFLAKIVDESTNADELQFRWRGAAHDDYFSLQDRLQKLYKIGMEKFLGEEVTYIDQREVSDAFHFFKNDPDATRDKILSYFRQLKFFTNSDFAFLDVHNETLFYKNAVILKEMVQMLQDMKLRTKEPNQFLGDLFEGFLDQGVKQNEGQYLTPTPLVKFIVSSLPLAAMAQAGGEVPFSVDYACGAGHFLTEYAEEIKKLAAKIPSIDIKEYNRRTVGIEKEYRLSKVAKVSAFMYGHEDIRIIYGDALAVHDGVKDGAFSVLVANPPYSVKGFLETLPEAERERFSLTPKVSDISVNNSVETFFVERAKQLLAGGGVAAIILPSSILSKGGIYEACREIVLNYFHIVAIAQFAGGAFGKTGTNTVTLFLRRRDENPDASTHYKNRVEAWFQADDEKDAIFADCGVLADYCAHCQLDADAYKAWLAGGAAPDAPIFSSYAEAARKSAKYKQIAKKRTFVKYTPEMKEAELAACIDTFAKDKERAKLYYFMLAADAPAPVVVVKSPEDTGKEKAFLGYEWSNRKGDEGIKYLDADGIDGMITPMFNPQDLDDAQKINALIRGNFEGKEVVVPEHLREFVSVHRLTDMLDFGGVAFDKAIKPASDAPLIIGSGHFDKKELKQLISVCQMNLSKTEAGNMEADALVSFVEMASVSNDGYIETMIDRPVGELRTGSYTYFAENDILLAKITPCMENGKCGIARNLTNGIGFGSSEFHTFRCNEKELLPEYLFVVLNQDYVRKAAQLAMTGASGHRRVPASFYANMTIPVPSIKMQRQITTEFDKIDAKIKAQEDTVDKCKDNVKAKFIEMFGDASSNDKNWPVKSIGEIVADVHYGTSAKADEHGKYKYLRMNNITYDGYLDFTDLKYIDISDSEFEKYVVRKGDVLFNRTNSIELVGKTALFDLDEEMIIAGYIIRLRLKGEVAPQFLVRYLNLDYTKRLFQGMAKRAVNQANINAQDLQSIRIYVPPITLQNEFADFARDMDKKKAAALRQKKKLVAEREQLVSKYFR